MRIRSAVVLSSIVGGLLLAVVPVLPSPAIAAPAIHAELPAHADKRVCAVPAAGRAACHARVVTDRRGATPLASSSYTYGYAPATLRSAYGLGDGTTSTATVAIVDAYDNPNAAIDLSRYRRQFGQFLCPGADPVTPQASDVTSCGILSKVNQSGGTTYPAADVGWGQEIALDVDMVSAICPTCKILLVEASSNSFGNLFAAVDYAATHASYVSNSYGANEFSSEASYDYHFNRPGVAITVSSGDSGYGVEYPAASQYVTAVGGTSLSVDSTGLRTTETAWSGAGSGCSAYIAKPSWQHDTGCGRRTVADVSAVANPSTGVAVYDSYGSTNGNNWYVFGGTSVASPIVASIYALAGAVGPSDYAATYPYANASSLLDVTSGSNGTCATAYLCTSGVGYDGPTGLGAPNTAAAIAPGTASGGTTPPANQPPTVSIAKSCPGTSSCTFTATASELVTYAWSNVSSSNGNTATANYRSTGTYVSSVTVTDAGGATGSASVSVTCSWSGRGNRKTLACR